MTTDETALEEVRERFSQDRFATVNGAVIEAVGEGYAKCSIILNETHRNALGAVMGGAIFTLADFAFAVASNWNKAATQKAASAISTPHRLSLPFKSSQSAFPSTIRFNR